MSRGKPVVQILSLLAVLAAPTPEGFGQQAAKSATLMAPLFQVDPAWPKLPNNWAIGPVAWVAAGRNGHVWILHRYRFVSEDKKANAAPPVLEFDGNGAFVKGWGGDATGYDWPATEHGLYIDYKGNVWVTGSSPSGGSLTNVIDNMVLKFTSSGKFLLQIGGRGQPGGNQDTKNMERPTDVAVYPKTNEVFVSDGYGNRRLIVYDADTGAFKRMWGAFGKPVDNKPPDPVRPAGTVPRPTVAPEGPGPDTFENPVHCVRISNDGLVYVCDRTNRRIQIFTPEGKYVTQVFLNRREERSASGLEFSPDSQQKYLYVADYGNSRVAVLDRKTLQVLYQFGKRSADPGDFQGVHGIAVDTKGNVYTAEVAPGNRAQRFIYKGLGKAPVASAGK